MAPAAVASKEHAAIEATAPRGPTLVPRDKDANALNGPTKAAIWLMSIEEDLAVQIMSHLEDDEIVRIKERIESLSTKSPEHITLVHSEFMSRLQRPVLSGRASSAYLKKLMVRAKGEEKANQLLNPPVSTTSTEVPGVGTMDPKTLAPWLTNEHPQIAAVCLARLEPAQASIVLGLLPENMRVEIVRRIAALTHVPDTAVSELERALSATLPTESGVRRELNGVRAAAQVLNQLGRDDAQKLLETLGQSNADLVTGIRRAMFTFDDLVTLDRRGFQMLLKEVQSDQLLLALKAANRDVRNKVLASLSKRAADMLKDDLETMGPVRLADVEKAQQGIVDTALQLRADGRLAIAGQGGEEFV